MSNNQQLKNTDDWWSNPWWLDERWVKNINATGHEVEEAFEFLKIIFSRDWFRSYKGKHVENVLLRNVLFGEGLPQLDNLLSLSLYLKELKNNPSINSVIKNLKSGHESDSANMELELGYVFHKERYEVDFPTPKSKKGKTPDVLLKKGDEKFAIECKKLKISNFEAWLNGVFTGLSIKLLNLAEEKNLGIVYEFSDRIIGILHKAYKNGDPVDLVAEEYLDKLSDVLHRVDAAKKDWVYISNENIGDGYLSNGYVREKAMVRTPDIPNEFRFGRLFDNGIKRAMTQLIGLDCPGIVAVHVKEIPDFDYLKKRLDDIFSNEKEYKNIAAVIIFSWQNMFERSQPCLVRNLYSDYDIKVFNVSAVIKKYHEPVWM